MTAAGWFCLGAGAVVGLAIAAARFVAECGPWFGSKPRW